MTGPLVALLAQLTVAVNPTHLQLGADDRGTIEVRGEPGSRVRLRATAGSLGEPTETAPGIYLAEFRPPDDTIPRIAVVSVQAEKGGTISTGWAAIALWGAAAAVIHGKPLSWMTVSIGPNQFGPVRADATGRALIHVVIPPGVDDASAGARLVPLRVPLTRTVATDLDAERVQGGRESHVGVTLYATSRAGQPLQAAKFVIRPSAGTVSEPVAVEAGVFAAVWTVPPDASGTARITASLADAPSLASVAEVAVDPAPPEDELPSIASAPVVVVGQEPRAPPSPLAFAVSPKLGLVSNGHDFTSPAIAAEASIRTDRFGPRLELLGEVSWAFSTLASVATVSPGTSVTVRSRADYLTAAAAVGFIWPFGDASAAFVHAGPTLARVQSTLKMTGRPSATASTFVPGAQFSLGIERRFRGSTPFAELRWSFSSDPSLDPVLSGSLKWFGVHAGARLDLL